MHSLLMRPEEAADALRCSRSQIYELLRRGEIPSVQIGRSRRISTEALEQFVRDRTVPAVDD